MVDLTNNPGMNPKNASNRGGTMNGAESLVRTLVAGGVDVCFTNPGTSEMHFVAALDRVEGMRCVLGLFEGVCSGAADGYYRMTDKPASISTPPNGVTSGPRPGTPRFTPMLLRPSSPRAGKIKVRIPAPAIAPRSCATM